MNNNKIQFIVIIPKSSNFVNYTINDEKERYISKIDSFYIYIESLISNKKILSKIYDLLWSFQYFIVDIENQKILELTNDLEKQRKEYIKEREQKKGTIDKSILNSIYSKVNKKEDLYKNKTSQKYWKNNKSEYGKRNK